MGAGEATALLRSIGICAQMADFQGGLASIFDIHDWVAASPEERCPSVRLGVAPQICNMFCPVT